MTSVGSGQDLIYVDCNCCQNDHTRLLARRAGRNSRHFQIVQCRDCGLIYVNPRREIAINEEENRRWDGALDYFQAREAKSMEYAKKLLDSLAAAGYTGGDLLELGCGMGTLLEEATHRGFKPIGIEITSQLARYAAGKGLNVINESIFNVALPDSTFDVVFLVQVLEHLADPKACLKMVYRLLRPGGSVYISVPIVDHRSLRRSFKEGFSNKNWSPEDHLYHFLPSVMWRMLSDAGFENLPGYNLYATRQPIKRRARHFVYHTILKRSSGVFVGRKC